MASHFGADQVNGIVSSRRQFGAHLMPDLRAAAMAQVAPFSPVLIGLHQLHDMLPLTVSSLLVRGSAPDECAACGD
ncbi:hypothetical protein [Methylobacterium sp. WSM2598]|uniref:hypothetical protein n=1 Tax=Methylobacterium sp. WSM2598 TaxID=398261 RepID=UPI0003A5663C|nr:hypothetical protein [Methylobacterium sp. WSM2598]